MYLKIVDSKNWITEDRRECIHATIYIYSPVKPEETSARNLGTFDESSDLVDREVCACILEGEE